MICSLRQRSLYLFNTENLSDLLKLRVSKIFLFFFLISAIVKNISVRFQNCNRSISLAFIFRNFRFYILIYY